MGIKKPSRITILDLAKRLELSPGAVSQALNGTPSTIRVSPKTAERALEFILDAKVDALMAMAWQGDLAPLKNAGVPVALIGNRNERVVPTYFVDQVGGYQMAADHLIEQGCRRLTLMTDTNNPSSPASRGMERAVRAARKRGVAASWKSHSIEIEYDGFMVRDAPHIHGLYATGYLSMKSLIAKGNLPDGIVCRADNMAIGALRACSEEGVRVPGDVAFSGFGDHPESSTTLPSLTSVTQPLAQMQEAAFNDLDAALKGGDAFPQDKLSLFSCQLVVRESSLRTPSVTGKK